MREFDQMLDYRLLAGSHTFPGDAGGACLNEVALVAAGLDYRSIKSATDCPPCFSRPVAAYVIGINDAMPDDVRQSLKAFVLRLAGSADTPEVERQRMDFIALETIRRVLPIVLRAVGLHDAAERCARAPDLMSAEAAARAAKAAAKAVAARAAAEAADAAAKAAWALRAPAKAATNAAEASAKASAEGVAEVWSVAREILDGALNIGRQAEPIDVAVAAARLKVAMAAPSISAPRGVAFATD